jgi:3-hydroxyacyl-[acyl-carrier-protein] dehydratase
MNKEEIMNILPHRDNMLLVEEAEIIGDEAHGKYHVRGDEFFLQGHFPGNPVVPGVILCEMMAQATCVLLVDKSEGKTPYFTSMNKVKFKKMVKPGDTLESVCKITRAKAPFYWAEGKGYVNGELHVEAEFSFALM